MERSVKFRIWILKNSRRRSCPQTTQNLDISRCLFAEDGKGMYQDLKRTCRAIVLLVKHSDQRRCRRGFLKLPQKVVSLLLILKLYGNQSEKLLFYVQASFKLDLHSTEKPLIKLYALQRMKPLLLFRTRLNMVYLKLKKLLTVCTVQIFESATKTL